jgi:hypothetical protein
MDESRWLAIADPAEMLDHLLKQDGVSWRKVRLWACACVRRLWLRLVTEPTRRVVEVVERFVDGRASQQEVDKALQEATRVRKGDRRANRAACEAGRLCTEGRRFPPADVADDVANAMAGDDEDPPARAVEKQHQAAMLRCVFGNPFAAPSRLAPSVLAWNDCLVVRLAKEIYDGRRWGDLPLLADALLDAGCEDDEAVAHLRGPGPHVRGCHGLDLVLGLR